MNTKQQQKFCELWMAEMLPSDIAKTLGITPGAVYYHAYKFKLPKVNDHRGSLIYDEYQFNEASLRLQDEAFQIAMNKAIGKGLENPPVGIVVSPPQDWGVVRLTPAASYVQTQSIAASCTQGNGNSGGRVKHGAHA